MVVIENKEYDVCEDEFKKIYKLEYCNLEMYDDIGLYERISGLINDFSNYMSNYSNSINKIFINSTHGGFLPILYSMNDNEKQNEKSFTYFENKSTLHYTNYTKNIKRHNIKNINEITKEHLLNLTANNNYNILFCDNFSNINDFINTSNFSKTIIISNKNDFLENVFEYKYRLSGTEYTIYVSNEINYYFYICFKYYIENYGSEDFKLEKHDIIFNYDNLINLCIMVKNGGDQFETMLRENIHLIDNWTILDTGSTDNTIEIITRVLIGKKKGNLYQEPFINFRDSRNRLLELAGTTCKYTLMLDDTYIIKGNLRNFLTVTRGDQFSDSFTLFIKSDDVEYGSNRILKTNRKLKYWFKIHEVIQSDNNNNVVIPINDAFIFDGRFDYMEKRTMDRKQLDLKLLYEELEDDPDNSRTHYYLAQTYNLLEEHRKSFDWFMARVNHKNEGFLQEKIDAAFEAARIANFKLNMPWNVVEQLYNKTYELDNERPDALYFIGVNYYLKNDYHKAYEYFKRGFEIGYPSHRQYSLKPTLSFHFLPKFLTKICYTIGDYQLGEKSSEFFIKHNNPDAEDYEEIVSWYKIYKLLNTYNTISKNHMRVEFENEDKPIFVFVADGGFNQWSGKNILTTGVGGSETYIIEMARYIQQSGLFNVVVFCNCSENEIFEGVSYKHLNEYISFIKYKPVHTCIVSRFSEYLPITYEGLTENVYLVVHDLTPSGNVIIKNPKLKNIFCLTEWHVEYFNSRFNETLKDITVPFYYGIDQDKFTNKKNIQKVPYKFIYSSFPNRGLLPLLQMWPNIYNKEPSASLHIYSDVNGKWVNDVAAEQMIEVRKLLEMHKDMNLYYHGWVDKQTLADAWLSSDIWFYPCIFMETFCLTALEAASSKTFVITNDLAALKNTAGDRGAIIKGDPTTEEWQNKALETLFYYIDERNSKEKQYFIEKNYDWACKLSWKNQANLLLKNYICNRNNTNNIIENETNTFSENSIFSIENKNVNNSENDENENDKENNKKNLIFFTLFHNQEYIALLELLLHSLYIYGNTDNSKTEILIYTTNAFKKEIDNIVWIKYFKINFFINDTINTIFNSTRARYQLFTLPNIQNYDNILYLDTDILILNDINKVFDVCKEDKLYVVSEYLNDPLCESVSYWGKELFTDEVSKQKYSISGFNSGVLLFKNSLNIKKIFNDVFDDMTIRNNLCIFYDQPFLNYHSFTNNIVDNNNNNLSKLSVNANNIIIENQSHHLDRNIIHFNFGFGKTNTKIKYMKSFLENKKEIYIEKNIYKLKYIIQHNLSQIINISNELLEGCFFSEHLSNNISDHRKENAINISRVLIENPIENVLEIGFNAGFSTLLMLLINPHIKITCIDICEHKYTIPCYEVISKMFPNRIQLIQGNSENVLPELVKKNLKYDMIHIDGGHSIKTFFHDTKNSIKLSKPNTILVIDDYDFVYIKMLWNLFVDYYKMKKYNEIDTQSIYILNQIK